MKRYISIIMVLWAASAVLFNGCEQPQYPEASGENQISDISVLIPGTDANIDPVEEPPYGDSIHFNVPYHYPIENDEVTDISQLKVEASIPNGAEITPALGMMDLSKPVNLKVEAANGDVKELVLDARLKKSSRKKILSFGIPQYDIKGIISDSVISFVLPYGFDTTQLASVKPSIEISPRATISPDTSEPQNFNEPVQYTVTAYDGSQQVYTVVQREPEELDYGIGYTRKVWSKSFSELNFGAHIESALAISGSYMIVPNKSNPIKYYDKETAEQVGTLDMTGFNGMCFQVATDSMGNIIAANYAGKYGASDFTIYTYSDVNAQPEPLFTMSDVSSDVAMGRKVAVKGNINKHAIITVPMSFTNKVYRWVIDNGQVTSDSPHIYTYSPMESWTWLCKAEPTGPNLNDPFFLVEPMSKVVSWIEDGSVVSMSKDNFGWLSADARYFEFNNANYLAVVDVAENYDTQFKVFDVTDKADFTKAPGDQGYGDFNVFTSDKISCNTDNLNATTDVVTEMAANGKSIYVYMLVTNGGIAKYELTNMDPNSLQ